MYTHPIVHFNTLVVLSLAMSSGPAASRTWTPSSPEAQVPVLPNAAGEVRHHRLVPCASGILGQNDLLDLLPLNMSFSERIECGSFGVPLDWADPDIGHTQIHYARYPAAPGVNREGTIFVDPGIYSLGFISLPGEAVTRQQTWMLYGALNLQKMIQGKYDIVVWNPRGYTSHPGLTAPSFARCFDTREDRDWFYAFNRLSLGLEVALDNQMEFFREQTHGDAKGWLQLQAAMIEACILKQNTTMLRYMGTAATVRDLVAMADFFDGPGSAVNFRGTESGARIGQYLLQMFPERAGRIVLQAPQDLEAYLHQESYETWREDVLHAENSVGRYVDFCMKAANQTCSRYWHTRYEQSLDEDEDGMALTHLNLFGIIRKKYLGWKNSREVDVKNAALGSALKPIKWGNWTLSAADLLYELQQIPHIEDLTLGMMPIYCGDKASDYNPEVAEGRTREIAAMLEDDIHLAPLFSSSMFPKLEYLCHLWPFRAVERLTLDVGNPAPKVPAVAPLVIQYSDDPLARHHPLSKVVPGIESARGVLQMKFGVLGIDPNTCMGDVFLEYLVHGKLPARSICYGDAQLDGAPLSGTPMTGVSASAVAALGFAVVFLIIAAVLRIRSARGTVQLAQGKARGGR
ncbi:hypothetical protein GY45DRAFT_91449 [Cubamyces sp. BRFM 1775]|nr:hypothetical protein GY45DRAFT_91449 [Cubamyces sp. BRFM 1775]